MQWIVTLTCGCYCWAYSVAVGGLVLWNLTIEFADGRVWKFITKTFMIYRWNPATWEVPNPHVQIAVSTTNMTSSCLRYWRYTGNYDDFIWRPVHIIKGLLCPPNAFTDRNTICVYLILFSFIQLTRALCVVRTMKSGHIYSNILPIVFALSFASS